eukprot:TRINITY_DN24446_c0_g1_i2.p1 TRINITY_DN24446_c0_g1~~TRINITY_DN24446_c0_g1_i2.p1  ORF type:complete len:188 (-),score=46.37 TRINITY_DN24446_c0_g1_i2:195-758(-)
MAQVLASSERDEERFGAEFIVVRRGKRITLCCGEDQGSVLMAREDVLETGLSEYVKRDGDEAATLLLLELPSIDGDDGYALNRAMAENMVVISSEESGIWNGQKAAPSAKQIFIMVDGDPLPWQDRESEQRCYFTVSSPNKGASFGSFATARFTLRQVCSIVADLWDYVYETSDLETEYAQANPQYT